MGSTQFSLLFIMHDRPNYPGGPIINYRRLLPGLVKKGHNVSLICFFHTDYPNARVISTLGIQIYPIQHSDTKTSVYQILRIVEKLQPDAFIPDVSTPGCLAGKWVKRRGIPVITSLRSDDQTNWGRALYFTNPAYKNQLSGLMCVSTYLQNQWMQQMDCKRVLSAVIPSGVPMPTIHHNQQKKTLRLCYAGRLVAKQKNIFSVIQSFINICRHNTDMSCTIIGNGPDLVVCKRMVEVEKMSEKIHFTGQLNDSDYSKALTQHQIIVLLSDYEGTPGALLDGMACGLIPVVLYYPGVEELVKHMENGIIVHNTEADLLEAVRLLSTSESLRQRLSSNAIHTITSRYSLDQCISSWEYFISECITHSGKKRHFSVPAMYILPKYNPLLTEDKRKKRRGKLSRLFSFFDQIKISVLSQ